MAEEAGSSEPFLLLQNRNKQSEWAVKALSLFCQPVEKCSYGEPPVVLCLALTEECFDYSAAKEALDQYQAEQERSVEVEFFNVRDLAERLLTEFSPWKKRCVYERSTGLYRLTLFYQKQEEADLVVRLMGYGPDLRITDSGHPIRQAVEERVRRQMDRMRQCRKARGRPRKHRQTEPETDVQRE